MRSWGRPPRPPAPNPSEEVEGQAFTVNGPVKACFLCSPGFPLKDRQSRVRRRARRGRPPTGAWTAKSGSAAEMFVGTGARCGGSAPCRDAQKAGHGHDQSLRGWSWQNYRAWQIREGRGTGGCRGTVPPTRVAGGDSGHPPMVMLAGRELGSVVTSARSGAHRLSGRLRPRCELGRSPDSDEEGWSGCCRVRRRRHTGQGTRDVGFPAWGGAPTSHEPQGVAAPG
jgi:hypothetical protein